MCGHRLLASNSHGANGVACCSYCDRTVFNRYQPYTEAKEKRSMPTRRYPHASHDAVKSECTFDQIPVKFNLHWRQEDCETAMLVAIVSD